MTDSLKELLDKGQYELAAYRLVYAVVKAQIERGAGKNGGRRSWPPSPAPVRRDGDSDSD